MDTETNFLECGKIINTHGVRGNVKIESWCDSVDVFCALPYIFIKKRDEYVKYNILSASEHKKCALVKLEGVDDMDSAILLKNRIVYAERDTIAKDDDSAFIVDMIGLNVYDSNGGKLLGKLKDVIESVASDLYVVETHEGKEVLVPAVDKFLDEIDIGKGIWLSPIPGMFED